MPSITSKKRPQGRARAKPSSSRKKSAQYVHAEKSAGETGMPRGLWSGTLSFGLVTIPVQLYAATRSARRSLRMLSPQGVPLARRYFNEQGQLLEDEELARGYELEDGQFVLVEDEELERLLPDQSRDINLSRFVPADAIPPLYFERAYVLAPGESGGSAYQLLASTMERLDKAGIATFVMRERQYIVAITAHDGLLWAETLRFQDELRSKASLGLGTHEPTPAALREMRGALKSLRKARLSERALEDTYWQRLERLVARKRAADRDVVAAASPAQAGDEGSAEVIDLMEVLKKSLAKSRSS